jgi:hypothetical protein
MLSGSRYHVIMTVSSCYHDNVIMLSWQGYHVIMLTCYHIFFLKTSHTVSIFMFKNAVKEKKHNFVLYTCSSWSHSVTTVLTRSSKSLMCWNTKTTFWIFKLIYKLMLFAMMPKSKFDYFKLFLIQKESLVYCIVQYIRYINFPIMLHYN